MARTIRAASVADPRELAFEQGPGWEEAISEYREILAAYPEDRLSLLRIAQAQRELNATTTRSRRSRGAHGESTQGHDRFRARARSRALEARRRGARGARRVRSHRCAHSPSSKAAGARAVPRLEPFSTRLRNVRARVYPCEGNRGGERRSILARAMAIPRPDGTLIGREHDHEARRRLLDPRALGRRGRLVGLESASTCRAAKEWRQISTGSSRHDVRHHGRGRRRHDAFGRLRSSTRSRTAWSRFAARGPRNSDGRVRQRLEEFDLIAQSWIVWFDGLYRRIDGPKK